MSEKPSRPAPDEGGSDNVCCACLGGKVIVVTGAAHGQGRAEAEGLAAHGAEVVATDVSVTTEANRPLVALDVSQPSEWNELATHLRQEYGRVDGLVNNAGISFREAAATRLGEIDTDLWNQILAVNLTGAMLGIQSLLPLMASGGSIVNVGSVAAFTGHYAAAYTVSKWGLRGLTQTAATQLGPKGIRVNSIHPGYIETPMTANAPPGFRQAMVELTPLGRGGTPGDPVGAVVFLMSDASTFITGAELPIDGGYVHGAHAMHVSRHS